MVYNQRKTLTYVIAGGRGSRLFDLTEDIPKPMLPFGGKYRFIDFVMSNLFNSELKRVHVLTQYNAHPLNAHINNYWSSLMGYNEFCMANQPQETSSGKSWYSGTADAILQNIAFIEKENPEYVAIFGADHIYKMDIGDMLSKHVDNEYDLSISALEVSKDDAKGFGVFEIDAQGRFNSFIEKPENPKVIPGKDTSLASMGNYIFKAKSLIEALKACSDIEGLDFGQHIIPYMIDKNKEKISVYNFSENKVPGIHGINLGYWKDVGTIKSYFDASMELTSPIPPLNLYNDEWEILTNQGNPSPARTTVGESGNQGIATSSYLSGGNIIAGGNVHESILSPNVRVDDLAIVKNSILFHNSIIGKGADIRRTIISDGVKIPNGFSVGQDLELDKERGFILDNSDIRVITKKMNLEKFL